MLSVQKSISVSARQDIYESYKMVMQFSHVAARKLGLALIPACQGKNEQLSFSQPTAKCYENYLGLK